MTDVVFKRSRTLAPIPQLLLAGEYSPESLRDPNIGFLVAAGGIADGTMRPAFIAWDAREFSPDSDAVRDHPRHFRMTIKDDGLGVIDPRKPSVASRQAHLRTGLPASWQLIGPVMEGQLALFAQHAGMGILLRAAGALDAAFLSDLADAIQSSGLSLLVDATGLMDDHVRAVRGKVTAFVLAAGGASSAELAGARERLRSTAPLYLEISGDNLAVEQIALADGIVGHDLGEAAIIAVTDMLDQLSSAGGEMRILSAQSAPIAAILRSASPDLRHAEKALLILVNRTGQAASAAPEAFARSAALPFIPLDDPHEPIGARLEPGALGICALRRAAPIARLPSVSTDAREAADQPRLVLEAVAPSVEGGQFAAKRVVGDEVIVKALLYGDGHEQLAAELQWRALDEEDWRVVRMEQQPNDAWSATFNLDRLGRYEFAVEGWLDRYGGFRRDFRKKRDAGVAESVDYAEGRSLVRQAIARADRETADAITAWLSRYDAAEHDADRASLLLAGDVARLMDAADDRPHHIRSDAQWIDAERLEARFSSWYELFPRSITSDKMRHGTFEDVIARLPAIRAMGFDTLYFPPIHPIGQTNRKGPNNTLTPGPDDVGSPYAIGNTEGGHEAIHPALGDFEDFRRLIVAAADHGLEIALDFAIQCSPDHPWLAEHPGWFAWRPDGSMKYAENPPKKYQDIVNVDFYGPDAVPGLWVRLRDIVLLWIEQGVKTFRVDNPHTKPLPFWEWMIGDVRARHPEAIFLAEAFTRPNMMYRLAKVGFSQSYTYFTWRDGKQELVDYITELTTSAPRDFFRPHFFVNTPDINPPYLQTSGRPGFRIRAALAATLSGLFGVYSGFELCEADPVPGKEEYLNSEKYEIRPRDWQAPGNIIDDIRLLNQLRRAHPALQTHLNTRFYIARNESVIYYGKPARDGSDMILVMVNLDPHHAQETAFEVPLWEFGLPDDGTISVEDLAHGYRFDWRGKDQWIRLDPQEPYRIWRIWSAS